MDGWVEGYYIFCMWWQKHLGCFGVILLHAATRPLMASSCPLEPWNRSSTSWVTISVPLGSVLPLPPSPALSVLPISPYCRALLEGLGLGKAQIPGQMDQEHWVPFPYLYVCTMLCSSSSSSSSSQPQMKDRFAAIFRTKTRDEWTKKFSSKFAI